MSSAFVLAAYTAAYGIACTLELRGLFLRSSSRAAVVGARRLAIVALFVQTFYLAARVFSALAARGMPLANWSDWCLVASWLLALAYVLLAEKRPGFGVFLLPLVLGLIALAVLLPNEPVFQKAQVARVIGTAHGIGLLLGTVTVLLGFSAGLMYLLQAYRLKNKTAATARFKLPSLEYLQAANERSLVCSCIFLLFGIAMGLILNLAIAQRDEASLPWTDPTVVMSALLAAWLAAAWLFASLYRPVKYSRKVAYLTVASFVALAMTLAIALFGPSSHARRAPATFVGCETESSQKRNALPPQIAHLENLGGVD